MSQRKTRRGQVLLAAEDWMDAALSAIAKGGMSAINIDALKKQLGVSRGSFYWHFASREELVDRALRRWVDRSTNALVALAAEPEPRERLRRLFALETQVYGVLLAARDEPMALAAVDQVTAERNRLLEHAHRELGSTAEEAQREALLANALLVGLNQTLDRTTESAEVRALATHRLVPGGHAAHEPVS